MKNIILIGMPGCGKTTIGQELAKRLSIGFFDCDHEIIKAQNMPISQIFRDHGEQHFRNLETALIQALPDKNFVISTGGGIVERAENTKLLRKNGTIIFINRPLERISGDIDTSTRPLLKDGKDKLTALYERRIDLYKNACHIEVENINTLDNTVTKIIDEVTKNG